MGRRSIQMAQTFDLLRDHLGNEVALEAIARKVYGERQRPPTYSKSLRVMMRELRRRLERDGRYRLERTTKPGRGNHATYRLVLIAQEERERAIERRLGHPKRP